MKEIESLAQAHTAGSEREITNRSSISWTQSNSTSIQLNSRSLKGIGYPNPVCRLK